MTDVVAAKIAIHELHARYTDAVWRKDYKAFGDCFAEDAEWRIGGLALNGRAKIVETFESIMGNFNRVLITLGTPILEVGDGVASGRTYINERCARANGNTNIAIGLYFEHFVEEGDRWRFKWRLFQRLYSGPPDLTGTYDDVEDYGSPPAMPPRDAHAGNFAQAKWGIKG